MNFTKPEFSGGRLRQNHIKLIMTKLGQYNMTMPKGLITALGFERGDVFSVEIAGEKIGLARIDNLRAERVRLRQNNILLRQTKQGQFSITLPKAIAVAMSLKKGDIMRTTLEEGRIMIGRA